MASMTLPETEAAPESLGHRILTRLAGIVLAFSVLYLVFHAGVVILIMNTDGYTGQSYPIDFAVFWGAAKLALEGNALGAFDRDTLYGAIQFPPNFDWPEHFWRYPPTWHMVIAPLGFLPFTLAWTVFNGLSLVLMIRALAPYANTLPGKLSLLIAAPTVVFGIMTGNNGMLTLAVMLFGLQALGRGDQRMAGLLFALLSVKPQIAVLIPFALAAGGYWRAIIWGVIGTLALAFLASLIFGVGYWTTFFDTLLGTTHQLNDEGGVYGTLTTWFGFQKGIGLEGSQVIWTSLAVLLVGTALVARVWAGHANWETKMGVLLLAVPVVTPYAHYYEVVHALTGVLLIHRGGGMRAWWMWLPVLVAWIMPGVVPYVRQPPVFLWVMAPTLTTMLLIGVLAARRQWR